MDVTEEMVIAFKQASHATMSFNRDAVREGLAAALEIVDDATPEQKRERAAQLLREANELEGYDVQ